MPRTFSSLSRTSRWLAGAILVAHVTLFVPPVAAAQGSAIDQAALVKDLTGRDWLKRFDAASAILGLPAAQREPATIAAVVREIRRLQKLKGHGVEELPPTVKDRNAAGTYYDHLVDIASESDNPLVIPVLVAAADDGDSALPALAGFGETAVPQMLAALRRDFGPDHAAGLLYALQLMCENQAPLTGQSRASIAEIDRRYLSAGPSDVVERAIGLAVLLNEPALIARVTTIANARTEMDAGLTLTDPKSLPRVAGAARDALVKIKGPAPMRTEPVLLADLRDPAMRIVDDAAIEILSAPPERRTRAMVAALVEAMPRIRRVSQIEDDRGGECGIKCDLMELAVKADDPALMPFLVKGIDFYGPALNAVVKRGDTAAPLLAADAAQNVDPNYLTRALHAFRLMLESNVELSPATRVSVAGIARRQLSARHASLVSGAIEVAALLGDATLTPRIREIAEARTMADAKLELLGSDAADRAKRFAELSATASKALARMR